MRELIHFAIQHHELFRTTFHHRHVWVTIDGQGWLSAADALRHLLAR